MTSSFLPLGTPEQAGSNSPAGRSPAGTSSAGVSGPRKLGIVVVLACFAVTLAAAGLVHAFGSSDGSFGGEAVTEGVAGVIAYAVAFGLAWWRPARTAAPRATAERTAVVLCVLGALLVPICFWNPMPASFAIAALIMVRWAAGRGGHGSATLVRITQLLAAVVLVAQLVVLTVHVAGLI